MQLMIQAFPNGSVKVTGPLNDKPLCYRLLQAAKMEIERFVVPAQSVIALPSADEVRQLGRAFEPESSELTSTNAKFSGGSVAKKD